MTQARVSICRRCGWTQGFRGVQGFCDFAGCAWVLLGPRQSRDYWIQLEAVLALFDSFAWKLPRIGLNYEQKDQLNRLNVEYLRRLGAKPKPLAHYRVRYDG